MNITTGWTSGYQTSIFAPYGATLLTGNMHKERKKNMGLYTP